MHFEFDNPEIASSFEVLFRGFFKATWFWWRVWILAAELRIDCFNLSDTNESDFDISDFLTLKDFGDLLFNSLLI